MLSGQRSAWPRRGGKYRAARIAVPLAIPMALGLTLGIILAVSGGNTTKIHQSAAAAAVAPGNTSSAVNPNCDIIVPAHPLSARGLATPYQLTGPAGTTPQASGCEMTNSVNLGAFVQATILNPRTGALSVYNPLVITAGTTPAAAPRVPKLPRNAIVTIDFGFNGTNLVQVGATPGALRQGNCVDGLNGSVFGQVSFCNGINFFRAAFRLEREGRLFVPSTGTSAKIVPTAGAIGTGNACPTVRNFDMVDQDQSDNVTTIYLLNPTTGQTAQDTAANAASAPPSWRPTWGTTARWPPRRPSTNCWPPGTSRRSPRWCRRTTRWCCVPSAGSARPRPTSTGPRSARRRSARRPTRTTARRTTARTWSTSRPRS